MGEGPLDLRMELRIGLCNIGKRVVVGFSSTTHFSKYLLNYVLIKCFFVLFGKGFSEK